MLNRVKRSLLVCAAVSAAGILTLLWAAFPVIGLNEFARESIAADTSLVLQFLAPLSAYLFRNALRNTLIVLAVAGPLACLFGLAAVILMTQNGRSRSVMTWLLFLPLALPVPAWGAFSDLSLALPGGVTSALIAVGVLQAWRILPFAAFFLLLARSAGQYRTAIGLTLCVGAYIIVSDVGMVLLTTRGNPFNATHVLNSWIYQTGVAAAMPGHAAVMALFLMAILAGLAWGITHFAGLIGRVHTDEREPPANPTSGATPSSLVVLASPIIIVLLLPIVALLIMSSPVTTWPAALNELFARRGYAGWLVNSALLAGVTALMTVLVAIPVGRWLSAWQSAWSARLTQALALMAMTVLPVAFLPLTWLQGQWGVADGRWLLAPLYIAVAICTGIWLVSLVYRRPVAVSSSTMGRWLVLLSVLISTSETAATLALSNSAARMQPLNSGLSTRLVSDVSVSTQAIGLAILLPTASLTLFYWWLVRSRSTPSPTSSH